MQQLFKTAICLSCLLVSPGIAGAYIGTVDAVPAATLLLPYFEVGLDPPDGVTTLFRVANASDQPALAHVVLWTDLGVPTLSFDLSLEAFGSREVDLTALFRAGELPQSGPGPFPDCGAVLPPPSPAIPGADLARLQAVHTGEASPSDGLCAGNPSGDRIARGYVTVDVARRCSLLTPADPGYFDPGGVAAFDNVLWGDWTLFDPENNLSHGEALVPVEASLSDPSTAAGSPTFYSPFIGVTALDHRERLTTSWLAPLLDLPLFEQDLLVWRSVDGPRTPFPCGSVPAPFPLSQSGSQAFDAAGNDEALPGDLFPLTAQRTGLGEAALTSDFGSLHLQLDSGSGGGSGLTGQAYVTSVLRASQRWAASFSGVQGQGVGGLGAVDAVPAATLLLPFFEVDLETVSGRNSVVWIHNASPEPWIAHVTFWTDLSVPAFDFNLFLDAHGSVAMSLQQVLAQGFLPETGPAPDDFPLCELQLPPPPLPPSFVEAVQAALTGEPLPPISGNAGLCTGRNFGDNVARGYITIDAARGCLLQFPSDPGYFDSSGLIVTDNVLWGEAMSVDPGLNVADGQTLVHVEASPTDPTTTTPGSYTFYGRYVDGTAADHRERLSERWAVPLFGGEFFDTGTELVVWRDTGLIATPFPCDTLPPPHPLGQGPSTAFDRAGGGELLADALLGAEAQGAPATELTPIIEGWLHLDLAAVTGSLFDPAKQAHVATVHRGEGVFRAGFPAVSLPAGLGPILPPALPTVAVLATDATAAENGEPGAFTLRRTGDLTPPLTVHFVVGGSAAPGSDYQPLPAGSAVIPAGEREITLVVIPLDDNQFEGPETVTLTLLASPDYLPGLSLTAAVLIADDEPVSVIAIPTVSTWGLFLLAGLLAWLALRRLIPTSPAT